MKLNKVWASALALLALMACNKDMEPSETIGRVVEAPQTKEVYVDLKVEQPEQGLRVAFGLKDDGSGKTTGLLMSERNVWLRVAVKRGDGQSAMQDLLFTKTPGRNYATYSGQISIPVGGSGDYKISAILLKEDGEEATGAKVYGRSPSEVSDPTLYRAEALTKFQSTRLLSHTASEIEANIPYITDWQPVTVVDDRVQSASLLLRPFGTLLRMRIKNSSSEEKTFKYIRFVTNAFGCNIDFDSDRIRGNRPHWTTDAEFLALSLPASSNKVASGAYSPWFYTVVFPRELTGGTTARTTGSVLLNGGSQFQKVFTTTQPLPYGSVPVTLIYTDDNHEAEWESLIERDEWGSTPTQPKLAIEYLATHDLNQAGNAFVTNHNTDNTQVGRFNIEELRALPSSFTIDTKKYHIPTRGEMLSIFPPRTDLVSGGLNYIDKLSFSNFVEEDVKIGNTVRTYVSDYIKKAKTSAEPLYALRFKYSNNCTAYRYRSIEVSGTSGQRALVVDCVYVGPNDAVTIAQVATPQFWVQNNAQIKSRTFPLYGAGYGSANALIKDMNTHAFFWTTTQQESEHATMGALDNGSWAAVISKPATTRGVVRLFSDN